jgi:hypothetical protein
MIIVATVFCFAQMFYTVLVPPACSDASHFIQNPSCRQNEYYLTVYTVLLGDLGTFSREDLQGVCPVLLMVLFTFMIVVVLLNMLIALIGESHKKCLTRAEMLFGRARLVRLAELVSFQNLLMTTQEDEPATSSDSSSVENQLSSSGESSYYAAGNTISTRGTIFLVLSSLVWMLSVICEMLVHSSLGWSIAMSVLNLALLFGIIAFLTEGASGENWKDTQDCNYWYEKTVLNGMRWLMNTTSDQLGEMSKSTNETEPRGIIVQSLKESERLRHELTTSTKEKESLRLELTKMESEKLRHESTTATKEKETLRLELATKESEKLRLELAKMESEKLRLELATATKESEKLRLELATATKESETLRLELATANKESERLRC